MNFAQLGVKSSSMFHAWGFCLDELKFALDSLLKLRYKGCLLLQYGRDHFKLILYVLGFGQQRHLFAHLCEVVVEFWAFFDFTLVAEPFFSMRGGFFELSGELRLFVLLEDCQCRIKSERCLYLQGPQLSVQTSPRIETLHGLYWYRTSQSTGS